MADKKLTTEEILARARAQSGKSSEGAAASSDAAPSGEGGAAQSETAAAPEAAGAGQAAPVKTPGSTSDILAAARAQAAKKAGGAAAGSAESPKSAAPKSPAATPKSTADILAAARAQSGKGAGSADQNVASAKYPAKKAAPLPAGDRPSVEEMVRAVREGKPAGVGAGEAASAKPVLPPTPKKPERVAPAARKGEPRRNVLVALLLSPFAFAWTLLAAVSAMFTLGMARFMFPNVLVEPPTRFKVGPPSEYPLGVVSTKWKAQRGIWVVNSDQYTGQPIIYALLSICTHLGCTPNWLEGEQKFKCPCHGSGFYITGVNFEGPAPRPLERVGIKLAPDGMLEVDKSVKFQEEMGQWTDPASFVEVV